MHTALLSPFNTGPSRGNLITVRRLADNLPSVGCQPAIIPLDTMPPPEQLELLRSFQPDLLHGFHAFYSGPSAQLLAGKLGIPYLLTITGSDLFNEAMRLAPQTASAVAHAKAITCFDALISAHFAEAFPDSANKVHIVPQGVAPLPPATPPEHRSAGLIILLPAAIRPVKGILEALAALTPLKETLPTLRLVLAGGGLDREYENAVKKQVENLDWVTMRGDMPHEQMAGLYAAADIVLNCSLFEGGMANALLEAMAVGRPVLARNIPGNRSLIQHGKTGWLYETDEELRNCVLKIMKRPDRGETIGQAACHYVTDHFSVQQEVGKLANLYKELLQLQ